jgi:hypothetical protein
VVGVNEVVVDEVGAVIVVDDGLEVVVSAPEVEVVLARVEGADVLIVDPETPAEQPLTAVDIATSPINKRIR